MSAPGRRAAFALIAAACAWLWLARGPQHAEPARPSTPLAREPHEPVQTSAPASTIASARAEIARPTRALPRSASEELEHPHPITSLHESQRREHTLVAALNDALDLADGARLRELIELYDEAQPEDPQRLREGYERVADCLEAPDEASRASARANAAQFYDDARASTLRRHIRRHCLEPEN